MPTSVIFIMLALVLYTIAIYSERFFIKKITFWILIIFIIGFTCDIIGTSMMLYKFDFSKLNSHSIYGMIALLIMGLHLTWAMIGYRKGGQAEKSFQKYSLIAWAVWIIAFISGKPN